MEKLPNGAYPRRNAESVRSHHRSLFCVPFVQAVAKKRGIPFEEALDFVVDVYAVIQQFFFEARPIGFPGVGVLYTRYVLDRHVNVPFRRAGRNKKAMVERRHYPVFSQPSLYTTDFLRVFIRDNAPYRGPLAEQYKKLRAEVGNLMSRHIWDRVKFLEKERGNRIYAKKRASEVLRRQQVSGVGGTEKSGGSGGQRSGSGSGKSKKAV